MHFIVAVYRYYLGNIIRNRPGTTRNITVTQYGLTKALSMTLGYHFFLSWMRNLITHRNLIEHSIEQWGSEGNNRASFLDFASNIHAFSNSACFLLFAIQNINPQHMKTSQNECTLKTVVKTRQPKTNSTDKQYPLTAAVVCLQKTHEGQ